MKKADVWMPLYIGDYLSDTMHLTTEQHGAYLLLIMAYWKNGGALSGKPSQMAAICRMTTDAWSNAKDVLAEFFQISEDGRWISNRVEREMVNAGEKKQKAVTRASNAANARWEKVKKDAPSIPQEVHEDMLDECPSPSPSLKDQEHCPQQAADGHKLKFSQIRDCYNRICSPTLPACRADTDARKRQVSKLVNLQFDGVKPFREYGMEFVERFFADCLTNPHWTGSNDRNWRADFDFVTNEKNAIKLLERICG